MPVLIAFVITLKKSIVKNNFTDLKVKKYLSTKMVDNHIN